MTDSRLAHQSGRWRVVTAASAGALVACLLSPAPGISQSTGPLASEVESILGGARWRSAEWGVLAVSLESGDTLVARGAELPMAPASNMKIVTTAAALWYLGPDYRFTTLVLADGRIEDGVLRGDLILFGTGDPGLSDRFYDEESTVLELLADEVTSAGIHTVQGNLIGDGSYFDGPLLGDGWDARDLNDWFAAPSSALSFNENVVTFRVTPGRWAGTRPVVHTVPEVAEVPVRNEAVTRPGRLFIDRATPNEPIRVVGEIAPGGRDVWRQMTVSDPSHYAAASFRNVLRDAGVVVTGRVRSVQSKAASPVSSTNLWAPALGGDVPRVIAAHRSRPLLDYLEVVNKVSHNLFADVTLKTLGRVVTGDGSFEGGARVVERFLSDEVGADTTSIRILDGSGLSAENRISPAALAKTLEVMAASDLWDPFWSTLPEAGNRRELGRMYRTAAAGNLRAKTGTIEGVSALSGVVRTRAGERVAFSIVGNRLPSSWAAKRIEDRIGTRLAEETRRSSPPVQILATAGPQQADGTTATVPAAEPIAVASSQRSSAPDEASARASGTVAETESRVELHEVREGENFSTIARRYDVELSALLEANPETPPRRLMPGQRIRIPVSQEGSG